MRRGSAWPEPTTGGHARGPASTTGARSVPWRCGHKQDGGSAERQRPRPPKAWKKREAGLVWRPVRRKHHLRRTTVRLLAHGAALGSTAALLAIAPAQAVPAQTISTDPFSSGQGGQHAAEVEPYAAASGN